MKFETLKELDEEKFRRLAGIKRTTFDKMVSILEQSSKDIEDTLINHPDFALPGGKALLKSDVEYKVVLVDATETPIERPKKAKLLLLGEEEKAHSEESGCCG